MSNSAFAELEKCRLDEIGQWLSKYGASIYGTKSGPWLPIEEYRAIF